MKEQANYHSIASILMQTSQHSQTYRQGFLGSNKEQGLAVFQGKFEPFCCLMIESKEQDMD